ncbi:hypothetical protein ACK6U2_23630 [Citrobacter braakii]|uniref:hypothetical protein n=1 Tax=Citrobacter braakii TaxID=57706 RepID=UPI003C2AB796
MDNEFLKWSIGVLASSGIIGGVGILFRDTLGRFMGKAIEHKFEKKIEEFKSEVREGEKELEQMRAYLSSARSGRDSLLQAKRFEAAENLIKIRQYLYSFNMVIVYMKMLKIEELSKNINDHKVKAFIDAIIQPLKLDEKFEEYKKFDVDTPTLYLSDRAIKAFQIHQGIIMVGAAKLKMLSVAVENTPEFINGDSLIAQIVDYIPSSESGFKEFGFTYVFQWHEYFREELLKEIRKDLNVDGNIKRDAESAAMLAIGARDAQQKVKESIKQYGLSDDLLNHEMKI